jgi:hypothetical protein
MSFLTTTKQGETNEKDQQNPNQETNNGHSKRVFFD